MESAVSGTVLPVLQIMLQPGELLVAETGELSWKTPNVMLRTTTATGGSSGFSARSGAWRPVAGCS